MPALSNTYRLSESYVSENTLNDSFSINKPIISSFFQSTLIKEEGAISSINRFEIQKIKEFKDLEPNWDSYGAEPISDDVISKSIDLIKEIDALDEDIYFTSPGPNGEVMIQLKKNEKEVEIIIYKEKTKYVTFSENDFNKQGQLDLKILPEIIEWINV